MPLESCTYPIGPLLVDLHRHVIIVSTTPQKNERHDKEPCASTQVNVRMLLHLRLDRFQLRQLLNQLLDPNHSWEGHRYLNIVFDWIA